MSSSGVPVKVNMPKKAPRVTPTNVVVHVGIPRRLAPVTVHFVAPVGVPVGTPVAPVGIPVGPVAIPPWHYAYGTAEDAPK